MTQVSDGKALAEGTDVEATTKGSEKQDAPQNSYTVEQLAEQYKKLSEKLDAIARSTQSEKDKGVKRVEQKVDNLEKDLRTVLQRAQKEGKSVADVLSEIEDAEEHQTRAALNAMAQAFLSGKFPTPQALGGAEGEGDYAAEVVKTLELDENDMRVKEFRTKKFESKEQAALEAAKLTKRLAQQPTDADKESAVAERARLAGKQEVLMAKYLEGSKNLRGQALINFKMKMRKEGLQIS